MGRQGAGRLRQAEIVLRADRSVSFVWGRASVATRPDIQTQSMEWILKCLDELDDLRALVRVQAGAVLVTAILLVAFLAVVAGMFVLGPPELLAAP